MVEGYIDWHPANSLHTVLNKKRATFFLNNSMKHWLIFIIFGTEHQEET